MSLNEYSKRAKDSLTETLPILSSELQEQHNGSFLIEALSPSGIAFWLSSEGDEITEGFDLHHVHFGNLSDPDPVEDVREASVYLHKLMSGQSYIVVWSRNGEFVQSETVEAEVSTPNRYRSLFDRWWLRHCSVEVRRW